MTRTAGLFVLMLAGQVRGAEPPIKPSLVKWDGKVAPVVEIIDAIAKQSGITIDRSAVPVSEKYALQVERPFWNAIQIIADNAKFRIVVGGKGDRIALVKNDGIERPAASVAGPFRCVVKQVTGKTDFDSGLTSHEIQLDFHWEPRVPVFRVNGMNASIALEQREAPTVMIDQPKANVVGSRHQLSFRIVGLSRSDSQIKKMSGSVTITAAEKMLRIAFEDLTAKEPKKVVENVTIKLLKWEKLDDLWEARVELNYPAGMPAFESFEAESWLRDNVCRLVSLDRTKSFVSNDFQVRVTPNGAVIDYRFKEDRAKGLTPGKGWSLEVDTPSSLLEFPVTFELKGIKLP